ncbi:hypothetical protein [Sphingomonas panaciterrae]|uniref:hypothetical protein n=1 Tax=Sphingomonas panaciterrae TaxID=1462999 RepID=UPI002FF2F3F3
MPRTKRPKPLYQRGDFKLLAREGRANLEIVWYDAEAGRERSASAGTSDLGEAKLALDRKYLTATGHRFCESCGRPFDGDASPTVVEAIRDYLLLSEEKAGYAATRGRLALAVEYIAQTDLNVTCAAIDVRWVDAYRKWLAAKPVVSPNGNFTRARSLGHVEGCVRQLAAAINATPGQAAQFKAEQPKAVAVSPRYRADVPMLAAMFRFAMEIPEREHLLAYLRAAVATWARPEEIFDLQAGQWIPEAKVLDLNPPGRRQTRKYRGRIPIARQFAPFLDDMGAEYMSVTTVRVSWDKMRGKIGMPSERGEAGIKLIRRSMATLARRRIGEANWRQGEMMLGHVKTSISDIYAIPDPANYGLALEATESIIDEICALAPGAFYRTVTANGAPLKLVEGGKNG